MPDGGVASSPCDHSSLPSPQSPIPPFGNPQQHHTHTANSKINSTCDLSGVADIGEERAGDRFWGWIGDVGGVDGVNREWLVTKEWYYYNIPP
ncbi:hypothetical protein [uncultured Nostoc sp.]|uniref:hypothetical protein n=1 Tax=uncultured Nostoc sp. TaxID=340711 RepID=UPI0035C9C979